MEKDKSKVIDFVPPQETRGIISHNPSSQHKNGTISDDLASAIKELIQRLHDSNPMKKQG